MTACQLRLTGETAAHPGLILRVAVIHLFEPAAPVALNGRTWQAFALVLQEKGGRFLVRGSWLGLGQENSAMVMSHLDGPDRSRDVSNPLSLRRYCEE